MATDENELSGIAGDWKAKVVGGLFLFVIGIVGLSDLLPIGWGLATRWTTSTMLVLVGLAVLMYGLATITR